MEEEIIPNVEKEHTVDTAWVFDVDGVITSPQEKRDTLQEIIDHIANKLNSGEPVALNTGGSLSWLINSGVVNSLLDKVKDKKNSENLFAVGEKGGTSLTVNEFGETELHRDESISVPDDLQQRVKTRVETNYPNSMFYDSTKQTMISIEMIDGYSIEEYKKDQDKLEAELNQLLQENNLSDELKVDPTTIAVDVENRHIGKGFARVQILNWLKEEKIKPKQFVAVGDSKSDIEIAEKLHENNLPFTFVFVGNSNDLKGKEYPFSISYTQNRFESGTLEYLSEH